MKKLILTLTLCINLIVGANAQSMERPFSLGIYGGLTQYNGDLGQGIYDFSQTAYGHIGLGVGWYVNPHWDFAMNASFGDIGYAEKLAKSFHAQQIQWNGHFNYNILTSDNHKLIPYLLGGIGVSYLSKTEVKSGADFYVPFGFGVRYKLTDQINVSFQETYAYTDHDNRDGEVHDNNDGFAMHSFGIAYTFSGGKDADNDGVSDKKDHCPNTPAGVKVDLQGCPLDKDGDGVADYLDSCPDVKGTILAKGCPDKDGDGITDAADKCPDVFGIVSMKGCPDKDGDGITDIDDMCPNVKGLASMFGCPDTDGDGITDATDGCPSEKGTKEMNGCPDKDADGISDKDDKCPDVAGVLANKGCPEIKEETKALFTKALQGIQFETGKNVISKSSFPILDNVAKVLNDNPSYLLGIGGHTDNSGDAAQNMTLSQNRADAVKTYLVNKGIATSRLTATGFGQTIPVADNKTAAGKAKNRRVEFKVSF